MRTHLILFSKVAVFVIIGLIGFRSNIVGASDFNFLKHDQTVCYKASFTPSDQYLRLNVKKHSRLTTRKEVKESHHPIQTTYTAIGKYIRSGGVLRDTALMHSAEGSVVVGNGGGARLAFTVKFGLNQKSPVVWHLECGTPESSPTPKLWSGCTGLSLSKVPPEEGSGITPIRVFRFLRVDPLEHKLCGFFEGMPGTY